MAALSTRTGADLGAAPRVPRASGPGGRPGAPPPSIDPEGDDGGRFGPVITAATGRIEPGPSPADARDGATIYWTHLHCTFDGRR